MLEDAPKEPSLVGTFGSIDDETQWIIEMEQEGLFDSIPWIHPKTTWANVGNDLN